jgi:transcriptional regulator
VDKDSVANLLFLLASRSRDLAVVAVITALYPAGTVLRARRAGRTRRPRPARRPGHGRCRRQPSRPDLNQQRRKENSMFIQPCDAGLDEAEWQSWIAEGHDFGQLSVNGLPGHPPDVVPTHFTRDGNDLLVHLARPNPVWQAIEHDPNVTFTVIGDYAFVPGPWRAKPGTPPTDGVPTSYYTAVQFICRATVVDDPEAKAELLRSQMDHFQPDAGHPPVTVGRPPYGRMLSGIRGLRLEVTDVRAKFKYDDDKPVEHRAAVADHLTERGQGLDVAAAEQQRRRLDRIGPWKP